jgi:hypothetical protein
VYNFGSGSSLLGVVLAPGRWHHTKQTWTCALRCSFYNIIPKCMVFTTWNWLSSLLFHSWYQLQTAFNIHHYRVFTDIPVTVVPPYSRVIRSKTYCGYMKPQKIPNAIYNVIFM